MLELRKFSVSLKSKADRYVKEKTEWLQKRGITVNVDYSTEVIYEDGLGIGGLFDAYSKTLSVAAGGLHRNWLPTFIHELQHAKQYLAQTRAWTDVCNLYKGEDALGVLFNWLDGKEYPDSIVYKAVRLTQAIELDAERKTVNEMINTGLSNHIDVLKYTRDANGYIYMHNIIYMFRKWTHEDFTENDIVNKSLPDHFNNDYSKLPMEFYRQAIKYGFKDLNEGDINISNNIKKDIIRCV